MGHSSSIAPALFIVAVVGLIVVLSLRQARTHDLAQVKVREDEVRIRPRGVFGLVALTRVLTIPISQIDTADLLPGFTMPQTGALRVGGGQFGTISAGTFDGDWGRGFFLTSGAELSLRLELTDNFYDVVVIDTPLARELAQTIRRASSR